MPRITQPGISVMKITVSNSAAFSPALYASAEIRRLEKLAIAGGIPAIQLMKRAGRAALNVLLERFPAPELISVYCGTGNNAGDGYILAGLAAQRRLPVRVVQVGSPQSLSAEAQQAYEFARQEGVEIALFGEIRPKLGIIVDALLGIGLRGELKAPFQAAIAQINDAGLPVLSLDVPSGLDVDTGGISGIAVMADITLTFIGLKRGLVTGEGPAHCGELAVADLGVPASVYDEVPCATHRVILKDLLKYLPRRRADAHKGDFGHVMVIGGDIGLGGAALMAAEAAARTGAGLISLATRPEHIPAVLARRPEIMACGVVSGQELEPWLARPTVLVIGPGLGRSPWSEQMLQQAVKTGLPLVMDADALNMLATGRVVPPGTRRDNWILTPHPGEAARLLARSIREVQADRFDTALRLQQQYGGALILKGTGSLVAGQDVVGVVTDGNPGLATGGTGDVLSGVVAGLLAQGVELTQAAQLGACLHAVAGDLAAAEFGQRGLLATDLIPFICQLLRDL